MSAIRTDETSARLHCPWLTCETTFNPKRKQDRDRHVMSNHLALFLRFRRCGRRDGREDEHKKHLKECDPGNEDNPPGLGLRGQNPVEMVEKYALDFVKELAMKQRSQALLDDPCGRQGTRNTARGQRHRYLRKRHRAHRQRYLAPSANKYATGPISGFNITKLVDAICQCPVLKLRRCNSQYIFTTPLRRTTTCSKVNVSSAVVAADFVPTTLEPAAVALVHPWCPAVSLHRDCALSQVS
ncbi:hypothetical protein BJV78DRAFT_1354303, partial [Lactifluus subvellereus]